MYAIYQSGSAIYGVGATPEAAWQAAREWLDPDTTLEDIYPAVQRGEVPGDLYLRPCSEALAETVRAESGDQPYTIDEEGILRLASELDAGDYPPPRSTYVHKPSAGGATSPAQAHQGHAQTLTGLVARVTTYRSPPVSGYQRHACTISPRPVNIVPVIRSACCGNPQYNHSRSDWRRPGSFGQHSHRFASQPQRVGHKRPRLALQTVVPPNRDHLGQ